MIAIGSDHGGYALKQAVMKHLESRGERYHDFGTYSEASCDYPDYGRAVAEAVAGGEYQYGIIICGTGIGISITANKVHGIRAATASQQKPQDCTMTRIFSQWAPALSGKVWH